MIDFSDNALSDCKWLVGSEGAKWLAEVSDWTDPTLQQLGRLRKSISPERAALIVQQVELRRRGVQKFGPLAGEMFFTDLALQQASDRWIAAYKASQFPAGELILDYCCGIGGDLLGFGARGPVTGWDLAPVMAVFAEANLQAWQCQAESHVLVGAAEDHPPDTGQAWHLDPDRRTEGNRSTNPQWHRPDEETILDWLDNFPRGSVKLAPGAKLAPVWEDAAELEWVSRGRECRQLVAWGSGLGKSPGKRRATVVSEHLDNARGGSFVGDPSELSTLAATVGEFIYDCDPAVRAAGLTGALAQELGCEALSHGASYLTSEQSVSHPLVTCFRVQEVWPFRVADLVKLLRTRSIGELEIKTRGVTHRPEELRKRLKLSGDQRATLLLTRQGNREIAILAQRSNEVSG